MDKTVKYLDLKSQIPRFTLLTFRVKRSSPSNHASDVLMTHVSLVQYFTLKFYTFTNTPYKYKSSIKYLSTLQQEPFTILSRFLVLDV